MVLSKFGPRTKAERKLRSQHASSRPDDSNAEIVFSETQNDRLQRKQALRESLRAEQGGQMSSKKKKRLEKYIDNKLRKEENLELLKKLAATKTDTAFLQSSKHLRGVDRRATHNVQAPAVVEQPDDADSSDDDEHDEGPSLAPTAVSVSAAAKPPASIGSGLKRPLEMDLFGAPIIQKRQRTKAPAPIPDDESEAESESSWEGLSPAASGAESDDEPSSPEEELSDSGSNDIENDGESESDEDDDDDELDSDDEAEVNELAESMFAALAKKKAELAPPAPKPARDLSAFKSWATQQINEARNFAPSRPLDEIRLAATKNEATNPFQPRPQEQDELPPELRPPTSKVDRQVFAVNVERPQDIQDARLKLPVVAEEQKIMEAVHNNPITIVCGATGSGKTTQIPQFLFEAGYGHSDGPTPGMIAVTQPRRVAAVTMAKRVSQELGKSGNKVAYQIRYGSTVEKDTAVKFMTDGILIREIASDFALSRYSAIVIDEAHERSVNTDILIGMLSRIVDLRDQMNRHNPESKPLKLIIMSATLMVKAFTENPNLFKRGAPPLVQSEGRQYPVTMHFARRTQRDYLDESFQKVIRGHKKLPAGAMLVFLTGENEIIALSKKLKEALGKTAAASSVKVRIAANAAPLEDEDFDTQKKHDFVAPEKDDEASDDEEEDGEFDVIPTEDDKAKTISDALVLPLYSKLETKEQLRVFEPVPEDTRLIVLATNVAETSITIPGVRYVFDCGRSKEKKYDQNTGVQSFEIDWISKASAAQRAGRAGRTGPGHCYRLYSSAVYERDFAEHTKPEVLRMPVEGVVLQLKSMDLQHVVRFPFPTPPEQQAIIKAEKLLSYLGAIDSDGKVTGVGRNLSLYPLGPRYAKMLAVGHQKDCMLLTVALVAALATPELFIPENQINATHSIQGQIGGDTLALSAAEAQLKAYRKAHAMFGSLDDHSDALKLLVAFAAYFDQSQTADEDEFCRRMFLRPKAMKEASQLFRQLLRIVNDNKPGLVNPNATSIPRATSKQINALKQFIAVGFIDQVAIRADLASVPPDLPKGRRATEVPYLTLFLSHEGRADSPEARAVYVHASSVLASCKNSEMPPYLIYSQLQRGSAAAIAGPKAPKVRMQPLVSVTAAQLTSLAKGTPLLEYGKPIGKIEPLVGQIDKRLCWVVPSLVGQRGITAWPLPAQKVIQKRGPKGTWIVEQTLS